MFYPCLFCPSDNMCGAPDALMRLSGYTFLLLSHLFGSHNKYQQKSVGTIRRVSTLGAPNNVQNFHLDKTNMDKTSQHRSVCSDPNLLALYTAKPVPVLDRSKANFPPIKLIQIGAISKQSTVFIILKRSLFEEFMCFTLCYTKAAIGMS